MHSANADLFRAMAAVGAGKSAIAGLSNDSNQKFELKKKIGIWRGVSIVAGCIVGSGIFVSPAGVLEQSNQSVGISLVMWIACGLFSALTALCYAELGTTIRESGAEFAYLNASYGGPVAFMFVVCTIFAISPANLAASSTVFGTYLLAPFYPGCDPPVLAVKLAAFLGVLTLGLINYMSVRASARIQVVFTVAKFIGLLIIIVAGFTRLGMGDPVGIYNFQNAFDPTVLQGITAEQIALAFYQGLFSYGGWNKLNTMSEEVKDVGKTLPRAIITSLCIVTAFYIAVNVAYLSVLTPAEMISSKAVAVTFASNVFPEYQWIMPLFVSISVLGAVNGGILTSGRIVFAAARREQLPQIISMLHVAHKTPGPAILLQATMSMILIVLGDFDTLLSITTSTAWIFYGLCGAAVLVLRRKYPHLHRPYRVPIVIPVIVVVFAVFLVLMPFVTDPKLDYVYGFILMIVAVIVYYPMIYKKYRIPRIDYFTSFIQRALEISPTDWKDSLGNENHND